MKKTQWWVLLNFMAYGGKLTRQNAWDDFKVLRLSKRIAEIKTKGIIPDKEKDKGNRVFYSIKDTLKYEKELKAVGSFPFIENINATILDGNYKTIATEHFKIIPKTKRVGDYIGKYFVSKNPEYKGKKLFVKIFKN
jgi:hypothetical protein